MPSASTHKNLELSCHHTNIFMTDFCIFTILTKTGLHRKVPGSEGVSQNHISAFKYTLILPNVRLF